MTIAEQLKVTEFPFEIWDSRGNKIYVEFVNKFWVKREFNSRGRVTYYEDSKGEIRDNRPKSVPEYTMEELTKMLGKEFKIKK